MLLSYVGVVGDVVDQIGFAAVGQARCRIDR